MKNSAIWGAALGFVALSCGDDDAPAYEAVCASVCDKSHTCDSSVDVETCREDCNEVGPKLNDNYLEKLKECAEEKSCNEFVASPKACERDARAAIGASQAAEELCDSVVASIQECTGIAVPSTAACLDSIKVLSDGPLRDAKTCIDEPCGDRTACVQEKLGVDPVVQQSGNK